MEPITAATLGNLTATLNYSVLEAIVPSIGSGAIPGNVLETATQNVSMPGRFPNNLPEKTWADASAVDARINGTSQFAASSAPNGPYGPDTYTSIKNGKSENHR